MVAKLLSSYPSVCTIKYQPCSQCAVFICEPLMHKTEVHDYFELKYKTATRYVCRHAQVNIQERAKVVRRLNLVSLYSLISTYNNFSVC